MKIISGAIEWTVVKAWGRARLIAIGPIIKTAVFILNFENWSINRNLVLGRKLLKPLEILWDWLHVDAQQLFNSLVEHLNV